MVPPRDPSHARSRRRALALSLVIATLAIGCGAAGKQIPRDRVTSPGEALFNGYTKSNVKCFECHDGTGRGTSWGPALATRVPKLTDDQIAATIRTGKGKMPSFASKLTDADIAELVTWLRGTFGQPAG
ncbi:MAG TPA: cytochrome c [Kofleriaceae bacterium]|nr:cytochrome c [Kofleriaceae bacterium]